MKKITIFFALLVLTALFQFSELRAATDSTLTLTIKDAGGITDSLALGESSNATAGLDAALGEYELPPVPPSGAFDVRWIVSGYEGLKNDYVPPVEYKAKRSYWTGQFQPSTAGYPITISWDSSKIGHIISGRWNGAFYIYDGSTNGSKFYVDMSKQNSITITDATIKTFVIMHVFTVQKSIQYLSGWNLLSVPLNEKDWKFTDLFSTSTSNAYFYNGSYTAVDSLSKGNGFWIKLNSAQTQIYTGEPFIADTFNLNAGWNLIGSIIDSVSATNLTTSPANIITSFYFNFSNGYKIAQSVLPGYGYWVKANAAGKLIINSTLVHKSNSLAPDFSKLNELIITDASGKALSLYFTGNKFDNSFYDMPPKAASETPDIRFTSGKFAEIFNNAAKSKIIDIQGLQFPINVKAIVKDKAQYAITNGLNDDEISIDNGAVSLDKKTSSFALMLTNSKDITKTPTVFQLEQNYPNPFNPSTTINYSVPKTSVVTIKVYDVLGKEITTLVNDEKTSGNYKVEFDGSKLTSGIYFYRMQAGNIVKTKKLILLK